MYRRNMDKIVRLAEKFIRHESTVDNVDALHQVLEVAKAELSGFTIETFSHNNVTSILVYASPTRPKKFKVILNGHLDVTPGKPHQYEPIVKGNRLYGVGAMDMKSSVACLIQAFKNNARQVGYPLGLQLVTDEQQGGMDGTKYQIDQGISADFVIAGESTGLNIAHKAKGVLWQKVTTNGNSAHSAYPWKSHNPTWDMHEFLAQLKSQFPLPIHESWVTTVALSNIETNSATFNKTPDTCTVWLDIRYTSEKPEEILDKLKSLLPPNANIEVLADEPALQTSDVDLYVLLLKKATEEVTHRKVGLYGAQGSSDARHYARIGVSGVEFGPIGEGIGTDDEWVDTKSLQTYVDALDNFLKKAAEL